MIYNKLIFQRCFPHRGWRYWYKNIKHIPNYFYQINQLIKYGYDYKYATYDTYSWFIDIMKSILINYKDNRCSVPTLIENDLNFDNNNKNSKDLWKQNDEMWDCIIAKMIELLNGMDEKNTEILPALEIDSDGYLRFEKLDDAKDEFFKLFSKYFWDLWD